MRWWFLRPSHNLNWIPVIQNMLSTLTLTIKSIFYSALLQIDRFAKEFVLLKEPWTEQWTAVFLHEGITSRRSFTAEDVRYHIPSRFQISQHPFQHFSMSTILTKRLQILRHLFTVALALILPWSNIRPIWHSNFHPTALNDLSPPVAIASSLPFSSNLNASMLLPLNKTILTSISIVLFSGSPITLFLWKRELSSRQEVVVAS